MPKLLVVDDDQLTLEILKTALEGCDYEVITASDGLDALNKARAEHPDIILLDIMLPKLQGYQVCRLLKFDDQYSHIPIIMITGKAGDENRSLGLKTGANEYVTKPFEIDEILKIVSDHLKSIPSSVG